MTFKIIFIMLGLSIPLLTYRMIRGPYWSDRILAADLLSAYIAAGLMFLKLQSGWAWDRDALLLVLALGLIGVFGASLMVRGQHG